MASLREALGAIGRAGDEWRSATPEGWTQGRTLYGGMTAAMCAQVAAFFAPDLPPLRSLQFTFVGPASGDLVFRPLLLRRGRSATVIGVDCFAEGQIAARGVLSYGAARESVIRHASRYGAAAPAPEACTPFMPQERSASGFFQNFEMRLAAGSRPFTGGEAEPSFDVWVRHRDASGVDPTIALLALADALPPAAMTRFPKFAPISTLTWAVDIYQPVDRTDWLLSRSAAEASADGYSQQAMEVFGRDGDRIASGRQTVAIFV